MNRIIIAIAMLFAAVASAGPLDPWATWNTNYPYVARQIPPAALIARGTGTNEYYVMEVDPATGALPVSASVSVTINYEGTTGSPVPSEAAYVAGIDPGGDLRGIAVATDGTMQMSADFSGAIGVTVPADGAYMAGVNGGGNLTGVAVDNAGQLQVDVLSSALPTGAATEAKQDSEIALLTTIDADTGAIATDTATIAGDTTSIDAKTPALGQSNMAGSVPVTIASNQSSVDVDVTNLPATVDTNAGNASASTIRTVIATDQAAIPASQSGTWNINNVSGTVSLPTGAATEAKQDTIITELQGIAGNQAVSMVDKVNLSYSSTNVTTSAYVQILASTAGAITRMTAFDGSGQGMILATGTLGNEVDLLYIPPGGLDGELNVSIPAGTRLTLKAITATASSGRFIANFTGP